MPTKILVAVAIVILAPLLFAGELVARVWRATGRNPGAVVLQRDSLRLLNPMRDRLPEHVGDELMLELSRGHCRAIFAGEAFAGVPRDVACGNEECAPAVRFALVGRNEGQCGVALRYWTARKAVDSGVEGAMPAYMFLARVNGQWTLFRYAVPEYGNLERLGYFEEEGR